MKTLDFAVTPKGNIVLLTEVNISDDGIRTASVEFIGKQNANGEKNAWWDEDELSIIDNLASILARNLSHPFGEGKRVALNFYPKIST